MVAGVDDVMANLVRHSGHISQHSLYLSETALVPRDGNVASNTSTESLWVGEVSVGVVAH